MGRSYLIAATLAAGIAITSASEAKLTRLEILERELVADGQSFGAAGPYERLTGTAYFEGDLRPGNSPALITFEGNVVLGTLSTVTMENPKRATIAAQLIRSEKHRLKRHLLSRVNSPLSTTAQFEKSLWRACAPA